jgi:hypothetical protein
MRKLFWAVLILVSCVACGDDDVADHPANSATDASTQTDAAAQPLIDLVRYEISLYDRRIHAVCPCLVAKGEYDTLQACLDLGLSAPDWADCETMALASYDNAMTRVQNQCYFDFLKETAECVETSNCDSNQLAKCGTPDPDCLAKTNERLTLVLTACPSFGLLSRVGQ